MKNMFAAIGALTVILFMLGGMGIGNFVLKFSTNPIICTENTQP